MKPCLTLESRIKTNTSRIKKNTLFIPGSESFSSMDSDGKSTAERDVFIDSGIDEDTMDRKVRT